jgi:hypothetical protein
MAARWLLLAALAGCGDSAPSSPEDLAMSFDQSVPDQAVPPDLRVPPIDGCVFCIEDLQSTPDFASSDLAYFDLSRPSFDLAWNADLSCGVCDGGVCDPLLGACAACSTANDSCADGMHCTRLGMPCMSGPLPCAPGFFCLTSDTSCGPNGCCRMPCGAGEFPCGSSEVCAQAPGCPPFGCCFPPTACAPGCKRDSECQAIADGGGTFARCCNGQCVDSSGDNNNCGVCNNDCALTGSGSCCCGYCVVGTCTITQTSPLNCGYCGHVCGNTQVCVAGNCQ